MVVSKQELMNLFRPYRPSRQAVSIVEEAITGTNLREEFIKSTVKSAVNVTMASGKEGGKIVVKRKGPLDNLRELVAQRKSG